MLKGKYGIYTEIMGMAEVATNQGPGRGSHHGNALLVEIVFLGIRLQKTHCFGAMVHDLEIIVPSVVEERIVHTRKSDPFALVAKKRIAPQ